MRKMRIIIYEYIGNGENRVVRTEVFSSDDKEYIKKRIDEAREEFPVYTVIAEEISDIVTKVEKFNHIIDLGIDGKPYREVMIYFENNELIIKEMLSKKHLLRITIMENNFEALIPPFYPLDETTFTSKDIRTIE